MGGPDLLALVICVARPWGKTNQILQVSEAGSTSSSRACLQTPIPSLKHRSANCFLSTLFLGGHLCPLLSPCPLNLPPCHLVQGGLIHTHRLHVLPLLGPGGFPPQGAHVFQRQPVLEKANGSDRAPVAHRAAHKFSFHTSKAFASILPPPPHFQPDLAIPPCTRVCSRIWGIKCAQRLPLIQGTGFWV